MHHGGQCDEPVAGPHEQSSPGLHVDGFSGDTTIRDDLTVGSQATEGARALTVRSSDDSALLVLDSGQRNASHITVLVPNGKDGVLSLRHDAGDERSRPKDLNWLQIEGGTLRGRPLSESPGPDGDGGGAVQYSWDQDFNILHRGEGDTDLLVVNDGVYDLLKLAEGTGNMSIRGNLAVHGHLHTPEHLQVGGLHSPVDRNPISIIGAVAMSVVSHAAPSLMQLISTGAGGKTRKSTSTSGFPYWEESISTHLTLQSPRYRDSILTIQNFDIVHHNTTAAAVHTLEPLDSTRTTPSNTRVLSIRYKGDELLRVTPSTAFPGYHGDITLKGSLDTASIFIRKRLLHDDNKPLGGTLGVDDGPDVLQNDHLNQRFERSEFDDNRPHEQLSAGHRAGDNGPIMGHSYDETTGVLLDPLALYAAPETHLFEVCDGLEGRQRWTWDIDGEDIDGFVPSNQHCYIKVTLAKNISAARRHCEVEHSGYLATLTSTAENNFVRELTHRGNFTGQFWIGYTDVIYQNQFQWMTGEKAFTEEMGKYENWRPGQPNGHTFEDCAVTSSETGRWDDVSCTTKNMFVCETKW